VKNDFLLDSLAEQLRDEARELEPFERRLRGELTDAELQALASTDENEMERALELYRPLSDDEQASLFAKVEANLDAPPKSNVKGPLPPGGGPGNTGNTGGGGLATVLKLRVFAPLAIAAAIGLFFVRGAQHDDLPPYVVSVSGGESELRGGAPANEGATPSLRVRAGSEFELVLRPEKATTEPVVARLFLELPGSTTELVRDVGIEVSSEGAVRIRGTMPAVAPGSSLVALVGRSGAVAHGLPAQHGAEAFRVRLDSLP
jgi:hypothetical protein